MAREGEVWQCMLIKKIGTGPSYWYKGEAVGWVLVRKDSVGRRGEGRGRGRQHGIGVRGLVSVNIMLAVELRIVLAGDMKRHRW